MKAILLLSLLFCAVSAWVTYVPNYVDNKPPWCEFCIDLAEKLKNALLGGEDLKKVAHNFCKEKMPSSFIEVCHITVDKYWDKVVESIEENTNFIKICIDIC
ncbi:unnamed protein product [Cylicocyclus nassatus]|uniref:Saposin B-type domain-containing protein n=1 Tax=Cylicocyclus nassatus TaxID=53992 RepID=A0AA36DU89_CYLNA|nr:unnamed protein product [Cylicocyclus nassatus]